MYDGKLVFAQVMEHLPLHILRRCISEFQGDRFAKGFSCQDQFRCISIYVLVAILKKRLTSLYTILQMLSVTIFEKTTIDQLL
jgi:hypothetical protein